jgi:hypothetical protein
MKLLKFILVGFLTLPALALAETEMSFDEIVDDLSRNRSSSKLSRPGADDMDEVQIHAGVGVANGVFSIELPDGTNTQANQRGVQINLGIDLLNPNFTAEGSILSFMERQYDNATIGLQEFDLKIFYRDTLEAGIGYRLGGGLAARYLSIFPKAGGEHKYTTPAWIAVGGLDIYITKGLSLGGEVAGRGSLTGETPDQSSMDFALRLDAHF